MLIIPEWYWSKLWAPAVAATLQKIRNEVGDQKWRAMVQELRDETKFSGYRVHRRATVL